MSNDGAVPAPLEWHPWYRNKTWLLDWLNGTGPYAGLHDIRIPVTRPMVPFTLDTTEPTVVDLSRVVMMTRRKAAGLAPYVGRPFVYVWMVGTDDLGRHIASDSRIEYLDDQMWRA